MLEFLFFMIGLLLGGAVGITIMCLVQINRINDSHISRKEDNDK